MTITRHIYIPFEATFCVSIEAIGFNELFVDILHVFALGCQCLGALSRCLGQNGCPKPWRIKPSAYIRTLLLNPTRDMPR